MRAVAQEVQEEVQAVTCPTPSLLRVVEEVEVETQRI